MIHIGYACQLSGYRNYRIKACRLSGATPATLQEIVGENLETLRRILVYTLQNGIRLFRISSDIVPLASHPQISFDWKDKFASTFEEIGNFVRDNGIRVSMHPGQYTVINSLDSGVVERAIADLDYHTDFLDALGVSASHKVILHIGGAYGDKQASLHRFIERAKGLPERVLSRLALENDDRQFPIDDVLEACGKLGIPAVFDTFHHACNPSAGDIPQYIRQCAVTWKTADGNQKIHYSQQNPGMRLGSHSKSIDIPSWIRDSRWFDGLDVMLEVKDKNLSAIKCNLISNGAGRQELEHAWRAYKYLVMRHSQQHYEAAKRMFRGKVDAVDFFTLVDKALEIEPSKASVTNAAQHIWGYFKHKESATRFLGLLERYMQDRCGEAAVFSYLYEMAAKHNILYLLDGYSFA